MPVGEKTKLLWQDPKYRKHMSKVHKGQKAWNKGIPQSQAVKDILSKIHKDKHYSPKTEFRKGQHFSLSTEFKKGMIPWNKDKKGLQLGKNAAHWKGGLLKLNIDKPRWFQYMPQHPFAFNDKYVRHSRLIAEKCLDRYLTRREVVHHINSNTLDDRPKNLYVFPSQKKHFSFHRLKNKPTLKSNLIT